MNFRISIISTLSIVMFFTFCRTPKADRINQIKWEQNTEKVFFIPNKDNIPEFEQVINENDREYLVFLTWDEKYIYKYDLSTREMKDKILIDISPYRTILGFKYHTKDSIFIVCSHAYEEGHTSHTGSVMMLNGKGEVNKKFSLRGLPIICDECEKISEDSLEYIWIRGGNIDYANNHLFIQMSYGNSFVGDSGFVKIQHPVSFHIDTRTDSAFIHPLSIPSKLGAYYAYNNVRRVFVVANKKGNPVVGYYMTSSLSEYDLKEKKTIIHKINSIFGDTVFPLMKVPPRNDKYPQYDYSQVSFEGLYYNPYQDNYVRITRLALPPNPLPEEKRKPRYGITLIDADFNIIAEGILPKGLAQGIYFSKNGVGFVDGDKIQERDTNMVFYKEYKLSYEEIALAEFKKGLVLKSDSVAIGPEPYLMKINFQHSEKKFVVFFNPINSSCQQCVDDMTQNIVQYHKNEPCYIIIVAHNRNAIDEYVKNQGLDSFDKLLTDHIAWLKHIDKSPYGSIWYFDNSKLVKENKVMVNNREEIKLEISSFFAK